ncbi:MAG: hypothetical protein WDZ59_11785 [Pirellulales bacterium]
MIRQLIQYVRKSEWEPGYVIEVQVPPGYDPRSDGSDLQLSWCESLQEFADCYEGLLSGDCLLQHRDAFSESAERRHVYLGIVHEGGALLVAVPTTEVPA